MNDPQETIDKLMQALDNSPCACGWHPVPDAEGKVKKVHRQCQRCRVLAEVLGTPPPTPTLTNDTDKATLIE